MRTINLTYFKSSGKYYTSGSFEVEDNYYFYGMLGKVRDWRIEGNGKLPGLSGNWEGPILVVDSVSGLPHLIPAIV